MLLAFPDRNFLLFFLFFFLLPRMSLLFGVIILFSQMHCAQWFSQIVVQQLAGAELSLTKP